MVKRAIAGLLWFVATMWLFNFASAFFGVPAIVGFLVAAGFGLFIGGDPLKLCWRPQRRRFVEQPTPRPEFVPVHS
jgi:hypothetical protein